MTRLLGYDTNYVFNTNYGKLWTQYFINNVSPLFIVFKTTKVKEKAKNLRNKLNM